jgi:hypothetical protein
MQDLATLTATELSAIIGQQAVRVAQLRAEVQQLQTQVASLQHDQNVKNHLGGDGDGLTTADTDHQ